jgi:hypothetical protein
MADPTPTDPVVLAAQRTTAQANALKAQADALTSMTAARNAAASAAVADLPAGIASGKVDLGADAGRTEATLLAALAAKAAAEAVGKAASEIEPGKPVWIFAGPERPTRDRWAAFSLRVSLLGAMVGQARALEQAASATIGSTGAPPSPRAKPETLVDPATVALGVAAAVKIAGLFESDFQFGNLALTADDGLLATAVAAALLKRQPSRVVRLAARTVDPSANVLAALLAPLAKSSVEGQAGAATLKAKAAVLRAPAAGAIASPEALAAADQCDAAAAAWQTVASNCDTLISGLVTPDATGATPAARIAAEKRLDEALPGSLVLFVQMNANLGGYSVKRNLWTATFGDPLRVTGGVVASYVLADGATGATLAAGVAADDKGYVKPSDAAALLHKGS